MQVIGDLLNVLFGLLWAVIKGQEHAPSVRILHRFVRSRLLWIFDIFMSVAKGEADQLFVSQPLTSFLKLSFPFFKKMSHLLSNLLL